jgi:hypothetical protein
VPRNDAELARPSPARSAGKVTSDKVRAQGLFPCEQEVARRLSQTPAEWAAKAVILERSGLPKVDPVMGGRFWPAVEAYWRRRYGLNSIEPSQPDGSEHLDAL